MKLAEIQDILSEAVLLSHINHPSIVRVFNADILVMIKNLVPLAAQ